MPVSPFEVLPFVYASDIGDRVITAIDKVLKSTDEKLYRQATEEGQHVYHFKVRELLTPSDVRIIVDAYSKVGWKFCIVSVSDADFASYVTLVPPDFFGNHGDIINYANDSSRFKILQTRS